MTTRIFVGVLVFFFVVVLLVAIAFGEPDRMDTFEASTDARSIENGAELFQGNCDRCHGIQGQGIAGVAPAINSYDFFTNRLSEVGYSGSLRSYVESTIEAGRPVMSADWPAPMPTWGQAYGGPLRTDQIEDLTNYVLNWREAAVAAGPQVTQEPGEVSGDPVERGMNLFISNGCGGCHLIEGLEGAVGQVGPALTQIAAVAAERVPGQTAEEYIRTSIVNPGAYLVEQCPTGSCANVMPADFGERLATQELDDIVTYLLTLE
jgi:mono/diheme cytochrome c family protein